MHKLNLLKQKYISKQTSQMKLKRVHALGFAVFKLFAINQISIG
jgi:hypothetical protein